MMMSADGFRELTRLLMSAAQELCGGRIAMTHEGGYSEMYAPYCGLAVIEELSGHPDEAVRLYMEALQGNPAFMPADSRLRALRALNAAPMAAP